MPRLYPAAAVRTGTPVATARRSFFALWRNPMSHRIVVFASVISLTVGGLLGCGPTGSATAPTTRTTEPDRPTTKERDVQVHTPGAKVDVHRAEDGRLKVDVRTKGTG